MLSVFASMLVLFVCICMYGVCIKTQCMYLNSVTSWWLPLTTGLRLLHLIMVIPRSMHGHNCASYPRVVCNQRTQRGPPVMFFSLLDSVDWVPREAWRKNACFVSLAFPHSLELRIFPINFNIHFHSIPIWKGACFRMLWLARLLAGLLYRGVPCGCTGCDVKFWELPVAP